MSHVPEHLTTAWTQYADVLTRGLVPAATSGDVLTVHYLRTGKAANFGAEVVTSSPRRPSRSRRPPTASRTTPTLARPS